MMNRMPARTLRPLSTKPRKQRILAVHRRDGARAEFQPFIA
jgi:hypothetical protein